MKRILYTTLIIGASLFANMSSKVELENRFKSKEVGDKIENFSLKEEEFKNKLNLKDKRLEQIKKEECLSLAKNSEDIKKCMGYKDNSNIYKNINSNISKKQKDELMKMKDSLNIKMY